MHYLTARDGRVQVYEDINTSTSPVLDTSDLKEVAIYLFTNNVTNWMNSSAMDFATDCGFDEDDLRSIIGEHLLDLATHDATKGVGLL